MDPTTEPTISFECGLCHRRLTAPASFAGKAVKCPKCFKRTVAPKPPKPPKKKEPPPTREGVFEPATGEGPSPLGFEVDELKPERDRSSGLYSNPFSTFTDVGMTKFMTPTIALFAFSLTLNLFLITLAYSTIVYVRDSIDYKTLLGPVFVKQIYRTPFYFMFLTILTRISLEVVLIVFRKSKRVEISA